MYFSNFFSRALVAALAAILVTACGGDGESGPAQTSLPGTPTLNVLPAAPAVKNALSIYVDAGPADTGYNVNRLYTDVTICQPGKSSPGSPTQCQTIKHVLVDTGSTGLRLLSSAMAPDLNLSRLTGGGGLPLLNCVQFLDLTYAWGPVATADIVLGGKTAASVPIQVIADPAFNSPASECAAGGTTAVTTAKVLGANGILGIGLFKEDCGSGCAGTAINGFYYTCTDASCTATTGAMAGIGKQVKNPVSMFASDNNGVLIDLPAVGPPGAATVSGSLIFGIGTQMNNQLASARVMTTNDVGEITTTLAGKSLTKSFIDTGSNGLYFDFDPLTLPLCAGSNSGFYCPLSLTTLSATLVGANGVSSSVPFSVDKATNLFAGATNAALPTLAGDIKNAAIFDWGLPFFYGRQVFIGIEGRASSTGTGSITGPFYAF